MAKEKKKSAKEASKTFHDIMKASVSGNPKPKKKDADKGKKAFEEGTGGDGEKSIEKDKPNK